MTAALLLLATYPTVQDRCIVIQLSRWPPGAVARANWEFARAHVEYLERRAAWDYARRADLHALLPDARRRRQAWSLLDDARNCYSGNMRRYPLEQLRKLIGETRWAFAEMPAPADFSKFSRGD